MNLSRIGYGSIASEVLADHVQVVHAHDGPIEDAPPVVALTTRIVVAGSALQHVSPIFALARLLQPSLVILEDVDLVFTTRDINSQGSILGELLDQMDGLRPFEDVGFVLTTNAIDRIEAAI